MSETRFTPGPWRVGAKNYTDSILDGHGMVVAAPILDPIMPVAEMQANARLIAAAPDLYSALEHTLSSHESECGECPDCDVYRMARAALSKARGETR